MSFHSKTYVSIVEIDDGDSPKTDWAKEFLAANPKRLGGADSIARCFNMEPAHAHWVKRSDYLDGYEEVRFPPDYRGFKLRNGKYALE